MSPMRLVTVTAGLMEAQVLRTRLEAENIPVHLDYESAGLLYGLCATEMGRVRILVPPAFERAARFICGTLGGEAAAGPEHVHDPAA